MGQQFRLEFYQINKPPLYNAMIALAQPEPDFKLAWEEGLYSFQVVAVQSICLLALQPEQWALWLLAGQEIFKICPGGSRGQWQGM